MLYPRLFSPFRVTDGLCLANRIVMTAMGTNFAEPDGRVSERNKLYYRTRAQSEPGLIITEAAYVDPTQRHRPRGLRISDDSYVDGLAELAEAVHASAVPIFQQLSHPGPVSSIKGSGGQRPVSASPIPHPVSGEIPHALTPVEIVAVEDRFALAAARAKMAGFDGVEIHGGHGYLLASFVSPATNERTDDYGGCLVSRMRFPLETIAKIRQAVGASFPLSYRVSATEFLPYGFSLDEAKVFAMALQDAGIDLLHVTAGTNIQPLTMARCIPLGDSPPGCFADLAAAIKAVVSIPVIAVGRINTPELAESILSAGKADLIGVGRSFIADPLWPLKARAGEANDISKCIACNEGCIERLNRNESISCSVNPWVGQVEEVPSALPSKPAQRRKVVVVGGGPAGMKAGEGFARNGHEVTLYEKRAALGGQILLAAAPPGKAPFLDLARVLGSRLQRFGVRVKLGKEPTLAEILARHPDAVVFATGSSPRMPPIKGIDGRRVATADEVLEGILTPGRSRRIVIIGGGMVGLETASFLAERECRVSIVEMNAEIGVNGIPTEIALLLERIRSKGIAVLLNAQVTEIAEDGTVRIVHTDTRQVETIDGVDLVVVASGRIPRQPPEIPVQTGILALSVGDCCHPRKIIDAISDGAHVAEELCRRWNEQTTQGGK